MSANIYYRDTIKSISKLPGTVQSLYQEVQELFGSTLPAQWFIMFASASTGEKKYLDQNDYRNFLLTTSGGENLEFYIQKLDAEESFNEQNQDQSFEKIEKSYSSIEEQKEELKQDEQISQNDLAQSPTPQSEIEILQQRLEEGLEVHELATLEEVLEQIELKRKEFEDCEKKGRKTNAAKASEAIKELEQLQQLFMEIESLKNVDAACIPSADELLSQLENELADGLQKYELTTLEDVTQEIESKRKEYQDCENKGRKTNAAKVLDTLKELERLQELFSKIEEVTQSIGGQNEIQQTHQVELENQLAEGLQKHELTTLGDVVEQIEIKRREFEECEKKGRKANAAAAFATLKELERLQELFAQIEALEQPPAAVPPQELTEGLQKYELTTLEDVIQEIKSKRREFEDCEKKGRKANAAKASEAIKELERLQTLFGQIAPLQQPVVQVPKEVIPLAVAVAAPENVAIHDEKMSLRLKSLFENFNSMPESVERSLQALNYYCSLMTLKNKDVVSTLQSPENLDRQISQEFNNFKERIKAEDSYISNIDHKLQKWRARLDNGDFETLKEELSLTMKEVRPLNIQDLLKLLREGEKTAGLIQNQDVMLLLGGTGSGKSTTIHFLAGSIMGKEGDHIYPIRIINPAARTVVTSSASVSETRYLHAVPVDLQQLDPTFTGRVLICDSPGFGDTAGAEVDIANAISIYRAVCKCRSVKPILLISSKGIGDRMQGLKELAHILVGMIPGIKDHIKAVGYFFTKYDKEQEKGILPSLVKLNAELTEEEKSDEGFHTLFKDLIRKARDDLTVIDPINGKPANVLDKVLLAPNIPRPEDVFKFSINEESKGILQNQAHKHQLSIASAAKRFDFQLLEYKLGELKELCEVLGMESLNKAYASCISDLGKFLHQQYLAATAQIGKCLVEGNVLTLDEVKHFQLCIQKAQLADRVRDLFLDKEVVSSQAYVNFLNERIDSMISGLESRSLDDLTLKAVLDKAKLLASFFEDVKPKYTEACVKFMAIFYKTVEQFKELYAKHNYEGSGWALTVIQKAISLFECHVEPRDTLLKRYENLKDEIKEGLQQLVQEIEPVFKQEQLKEKDIEGLMISLETLEKVKITTSLQAHLNQSDIQSFHTTLINLAVKYFDAIAKKIDKALLENSLAKVEILFKEMEMIKNISTLEAKCLEMFYSTFSKITEHILKLKTNIINELSKITQENQKISYNKIYNQLVELQGAAWINKYRDNIYTNLMQTVKEEILEQFRILRDDLRDIQINWDHAENVKTAYQKICILNDMRVFENIFSELKTQREEIQQDFDTKIQYIFDKIENNLIAKCRKLPHLSFEVEKVTKAIEFLIVSKKISKIEQRATDLLDKLQDSIRKCDFDLGKNLEDAFAEIEAYMENIVNKGTFKLNEDILNTSSGKVLESEGSDNSGSFNLENPEERNKNVKRKIEKQIKQISSNLQDLQNIRQYKSIYYLFDSNMLKKYEKKIHEIVSEVPDNMKALIAADRHVDLNTYIQVAKALSEFDQFLNHGGDEKFMNIAKEFYTALLGNTKGKMSDISDKIRNYDFEEDVRLYMDEMNVSDNILFRSQFMKLKTLLNYTIRNLIEETSKKAWLIRWRNEDTAHKEAAEVAKNLIYLQKAGENLGIFLDDVVQKIESCKTEVAERFSTGLLEYLNNISEQIANYNFSNEIMNKIEFAEQINNLIGKFLSKEVEAKIRELTNTETTSLTALKTKFLNLTIQEYVSFPPRQVLEKLKGKDTSQYTETIEAIERKVRDTIEEELEEAVKSKSEEKSKKCLRDVASALNHLPETMKTHFENKHKEYQENLERKWTEFKDQLSNLARNPSLIAYEKLTRECQAIDDQITKGEIENLIDRDLGNIRKNISQKLSDHQIKETRQDVLIILEYVAKLGSSFDKIQQHWLAVETALMLGAKKVHESFDAKFKNPEVSSDLLALQNTLKDFLAYANLQSKLKEALFDQEPLLNNMSEDFTQRYGEVKNMMQSSFARVDNEFNLSLTQLNVHSLAHCLMLVREWEPLVAIFGGADHGFDKELHSAKNINYSKMKGKVQDTLKQLMDKDHDLKFINSQTRGFASSRQQYYVDLDKNLKILFDAKEFLPNLEMDLATFYHDVIAIATDQKKLLYNAAADALFVIFISNGIESLRGKCEDFGLYYQNLVSAETHLSLLKNRFDNGCEKLERTFNESFASYVSTIEADLSRMESFVSGLKFLKTLSSYIHPFKVKVDAKINEILESYKKKRGGAQGIAKLGTLLNNDTTGIGQRIIDEHSVFKGYTLSLFNTKTQKHDITYVLSKLEGDSIEADKLKSRYQEFDNHYKELIQQYLKRNPDLTPIIVNTKILAENFQQKPDQITWNREINIKIPALMANIFALWTLKNSEHYFEVEDLNDRQNFLLQPHAAQVISIFRLLGVGATEEKLQNNLVQIGTGEGKSITLAVTAVIFALLGFEVSCACYSQYLCDRDYEAFKSLFDLLGLTQNIQYGTFNKLCESALNQSGEVRKIVESLITNGIQDAVLLNKESGRARILLIDEVDVFFSKNFYGELYTPSVNIRDPTVTALLDYIWANRNNKLTLKRIKVSPQYQACFARFKEYGFLVEEATKDMLSDVKEYPSHQYIVKEDKIGYVDGDQVSFQTVNRYQTVFAYYAEHEKKKISKKSLDENKWIRIVCGNFSYAEIPKQFSFIMGVTGTLKTLTTSERKVIEDTYGIRKNTYSPSVFGANNFKFNPKEDVHIENAHDYHNRIEREITLKMRGSNGKERAMLVFFESATELDACRNSPAFIARRDRVLCLTEEANAQEKDSVIKRATCSGQITFLVKTFGRGTDFVVNDQDVSTGGGLHVIQTFVSDELSEEIQIKGRTARQGDFGSFSMILLNTSLEKFLISQEDLLRVELGTGVISRIYHAWKKAKIYKTKYELIDERRNENFESQYEERQKSVVEVKKLHDEAVEFMSNIKNQNVSKVKEFLLENNRGTAPDQPINSKTSVLMDATGSMYNLLFKAKSQVRTMFERVCEILKEHNLPEDSFQIQFAVYRNYGNDENHILQSSIWETKPDNLVSFMKKIHPSGGYGEREAVELGLWHANNENEKDAISQVILIGDAGANTPEDVTMKRDLYGESYWGLTKFAKKTTWQLEAEKLKASNIPVHAFYVYEDARENFSEIANMTNGRCEFLDVNSTKGADILTNIVSEVVLDNIGQQNGKGDVLVQAYKKKFLKSYS